MDKLELKKGLRKLRDSIDDFLDNMDMDAEADVQPKKGKVSSDVEEDEDGKKKEH